MDLQNGRELCSLAQKLALVTSEQVRETLEALGTANPALDATAIQMQRNGYLTTWQCGKLLKGDTTG